MLAAAACLLRAVTNAPRYIAYMRVDAILGGMTDLINICSSMLVGGWLDLAPRPRGLGMRPDGRAVPTCFRRVFVEAQSAAAAQPSCRRPLLRRGGGRLSAVGRLLSVRLAVGSLVCLAVSLYMSV